MDERALARGIGWVSLAMGLTLLAPARAARLFGLRDRTALMRAIGLRDLAIGLGLLTRGDQAPWLQAQALADAADAAIMVAGLRAGSIARGRALAWLVVASLSAPLAWGLAGRLGERGRGAEVRRAKGEGRFARLPPREHRYRVYHH